MKPESKQNFTPSEDVFDEIDIEALPAIRRGLADSRAGRGRPAEEVFAELEERYRAMM
ncbi:hypothetical protein [Salipiger abyssi]|uniref:hypothetical protein n=1 Tax=Salipiger abyssi TaxID=1250539 RepID=UPI001A8CE715|nr:hypothetical protein [Salipiger abyssi]MBN9890566.1 hypothetical protein [Salipiger abyssi]